MSYARFECEERISTGRPPGRLDVCSAITFESPPVPFTYAKYCIGVVPNCFRNIDMNALGLL